MRIVASLLLMTMFVSIGFSSCYYYCCCCCCCCCRCWMKPRSRQMMVAPTATTMNMGRLTLWYCVAAVVYYTAMCVAAPCACVCVCVCCLFYMWLPESLSLSLSFPFLFLMMVDVVGARSKRYLG